MNRDVLVIALPQRAVIFLHTFLFVLGFAVVFVIGWGGAATLLGQLFSMYKTPISQIGGIVVISFGLHTLGVLRLNWLNHTLQWQSHQSSQLLSSLLMGIFFAAGWTPCIGTTFGAIITLGFSHETTTQAMFLASGYALGLGIPFLAIGLLTAQSFSLLRKLKKWTRTFQIMSGILQMSIGVMLITGTLVAITTWSQRNGLFIDLEVGNATPSYLIAVLAGLLSFLSPCVLPIIPGFVGHLSGRVIELKGAS